MLRKKLQVLSRVSAVLDLGLTLLSFRLAYYIKSELLPASIRGLLPLTYYWWLLLVILPVWAFWLHYNRTYLSLEKTSLARIWTGTSKSVLEGLAMVFAAIFFRKAYVQSRLFVLIFGILNLLLLTGGKTAVYLLVKRWKGLHQRVLVVGTGERARSFLEVANRHLVEWGMQLVGFLRLPRENSRIESSLILGESGDLSMVLHTRAIDLVVFAPEQRSLKQVLNGMAVCEEIGVESSYLLEALLPLRSTSPEVEFFERLPLLTYRPAPRGYWSLFLKDAFDKVVSFVLLSSSLPLFLLIAIGIKLSSKGAVFFRQTRCGLRGRRFTFCKFRTMREGSEDLHQELLSQSEVPGPVFKIKNDPRVTKIGEFLRKSSLDELPQLLSVLKGDMSVVGPRPPLPSEVDQYENWQRRRLSMKPGLTCIWQVSGRSEISFDKWMEFDLKYIDNWSLWFDLKILLKTIPAILSGRGAY